MNENKRNLAGAVPSGPHAVGAILDAGPDLIAVYCGEGRYAVLNLEGDEVDRKARGYWHDGIQWQALKHKPDPLKILQDLTTHDSW